MLPMVEQWFVMVAGLLRDGRAAGNLGQTADLYGDQQLAEALSDCETDTVEGLAVPSLVIRDPDRLPIEVLPSQIDERLRLQSIFEEYEACREELTTGQWSAVCLHYRDGLTEQQIAVELKKVRSSVHGLLKRAKQRKDAHQRRMREEQFQVARKHLNS